MPFDFFEFMSLVISVIRNFCQSIHLHGPYIRLKFQNKVTMNLGNTGWLVLQTQNRSETITLTIGQGSSCVMCSIYKNSVAEAETEPGLMTPVRLME